MTAKHWLRHLLLVVAIGGGVLAFWPWGQMAYGRWQQQQLQRAWSQAVAAPPRPGTKVSATARRSPAKNVAALTPSATTADRWPPTRMVISDIGLDAVVVEGMDDASLRSGPGHRPGTALPGAPGNCVIAAHRNVYGAWFYRLDEIMSGSIIELRTPGQTYKYMALAITAVNDADRSVLAPPGPGERPRLTLITCTLPHTANRIVLTAELVEES